MSLLLNQLKKRRLALGFKQNDMMLRMGMSRQQYQRLESKGNPRLNTLELVAKGLNSELMFIPNEKLNVVLEALERSDKDKESPKGQRQSISNDPWQDLLGDDS